MIKGRVRLHVPAHMLPDGPEDVPPFYANLLLALEGVGAQTEVVHRDYAALQRGPTGADFDFVHNGGVDRAGALNLGPAYLARFYYVDPKGIFFESSIYRMIFRPHAIPPLRAAEFAAVLRGLFVQDRKSRHLQPDVVEHFGTRHIAVFLQNDSDPVLRARHMTTETMVKTVVEGANGHPVVVKPHPRNMGPETVELLDWLSRAHPWVRISTANVHDILAGAVASVSIASSVALEGMMHHVPAILFGKSDLHHCAQTVREPQDWPAALQGALSKNWPFDAFLLWFLRRQNVWATRPFLPRVLERMAAQGADLAALGIDPTMAVAPKRRGHGADLAAINPPLPPTRR